MSETKPRIIGPNMPKLIGMLTVSTLVMVVGVFLLYRAWGVIVALFGTVLVVGMVAATLSSLVLQRPCIRFRRTGFEVCLLFGSRSIEWADVQGDFAVRKMPGLKMLPGANKVAVFNWTDAYKAKHRPKKNPHYGGYDGAISGVFEVSYEELVSILNERKKAFLAMDLEP